MKRKFSEDNVLHSSDSKRLKKTPTTFLDLPAELRLQILELAVARSAYSSSECSACLSPEGCLDFETKLKLCVATHNSLKALSVTLTHPPLENEIDSLTQRLLESVTKDCIVIHGMIVRGTQTIDGVCTCFRCLEEREQLQDALDHYASSFQPEGRISLEYLTKVCEQEELLKPLRDLVWADADAFCRCYDCACSECEAAHASESENSDGDNAGGIDGEGNKDNNDHGDQHIEGTVDGDTVDLPGSGSDEVLACEAE